ncbi:glycosyltransferase family 2 protein [Occultella glacieicola]|uniref:Glycosyltransferase family 2 protein n=1 Tax=Occultella glacieicola TaxID=2518684 RepID=A0ABY2E7W6_9MICO|nr:glycosyltransferase family 2 protein [Occultella glacieicola]TDE96118.1 glycosyltransferase family 2 protein [Occultella glacieicola]
MNADVPEIRVVCVTYHPGAELEDFMETLAAASTVPVEIVFVENGADPAIARRVADDHGATVVETGANLGYGTAANRGAAGASGEWLVLANPDVQWVAGSLDELVRAARRHPRAGALGPAMLNLDGTVYPSARALPSLRTGAGHALLVHVWPRNPWTKAYLKTQENNQGVEHETGWLSGACLLLRREAFVEVGGFDESYFMFFEDVDLGDRLARAGWSNVYVPTARVVHDQGSSWRERPAAMIRAHHRSAEQYLRRKYAAWYLFPLRWAIATGLRARSWIQIRATR